MRGGLLTLSLMGCSAELPRERIVEPVRRWYGDDQGASAGVQVAVGGFGPAGATRVVVSAPDELADPLAPGPPGRVYALEPDAPDGQLLDAGPHVTGTDSSFGNQCVVDLGDLDGNGVAEIGVCSDDAALVFSGPLDEHTTIASALARFPRAPSGSESPFVVDDMVALPRDAGVVLAASGLLARFEAPIEGLYPTPDGADGDIVGYTGDPPEFRGSGRVRLLGDREPPLYVVRGVYPYTNRKGVGVFDGWPDSGHWDEAIRWAAGPPFYSVFGMAQGDVDGDGLDDVIAMSHTQNRLAILTDPLQGGELDDAPIVIEGPEMEPIDGFGGLLPREWFGRGAAVGDLDHDGFDDLVVGAPGNAYFDSGPGVFAVFLGPLAPGHYTLDDADLIARDSDDDNDSFGAFPTVADLDGDGRDDLVIGSPEADGPLGVDVGMVTTYERLFKRPKRR